MIAQMAKLTGLTALLLRLGSPFAATP